MARQYIYFNDSSITAADTCILENKDGKVVGGIILNILSEAGDSIEITITREELEKAILAVNKNEPY